MEKLKEETGRLIEFIRKKTNQDNPWVVIRHRDIPGIAGASAFYSRRLLELLRLHPNVISEVDYSHNTRMKPYRFRYSTEKEKIRRGFTENQFSYLKQDHIELVKKCFPEEDYYELHRILSMVNYLSGIGAKESFVEIDIRQISDFLVIELEMVENYLKAMLCCCMVKVPEKQLYKLSLENNYESDVLLSQSSVLPVKTEIIKASDKQDNGPATIMASDVVQNLEDFRQFIDGQLMELRRSIEATKRHEEDLLNSYAAANRLLEENKQLKTLLSEKESVAQQLTLALEKEQQYRETFFVEAQGHLQVFYGELMSLLNDFSKLPAWQVTPQRRAELQKNILDSMSAAMGEMLKIKKER